MSDQVTIYALLDESGVRYIGQTSQQLALRLAQHLSERGPQRKAAWLRALRARGLAPQIIVLEVTARERADEVERQQIADHLERGCALLNGTPGGHGRQRRSAYGELSWACMLRLTPDAGAEVDRIAARDTIPSSSVCRRLIMERLEEVRRQREPHGREAKGTCHD